MKLPLLTLLFIFAYIPLVHAQENVDTTIINKIVAEEMQHSQIPQIAHSLLEVPGPRLTNSPGYKRAGNWAIEALKSWGVTNAGFEAWGTFGKGWELQDFSMALTSPYYQPILAFPQAWSEGTNGTITAPLYPVLIAKLNEAFITAHKADIQGKFLLMNDTIGLTPRFKADAERYTDSALNNLSDFYMMHPEDLQYYLGFNQHLDSVFGMLEKAGALAIFERTRIMGGDGTVFVMGNNEYKAAQPKGPVEVMLSTEEYNKLRRMATNNDAPKVSLNIKTKYYTDDMKGYNVIAEIPGSDPTLKGEVVMIGAHLDAWYASEGATDNGAGCVIMLEVMRLIKTLDLHPKRTIRIGLWSGEEQGILGSGNYVKNHFGDQETMKLLPEQSKMSVYYNLDNGSGKIRGIWGQADTAAAPIFRQWLAPFSNMGASTVTLHSTGSTDHVSFDAVGIPAFQFIQDPLDYETRTHHTNVDTYDRLVISDMQQAAIIVTSFVYNSAMRADMIPRKALPQPQKNWLLEMAK